MIRLSKYEFTRKYSWCVMEVEKSIFVSGWKWKWIEINIKRKVKLHVYTSPFINIQVPKGVIHRPSSCWIQNWILWWGERTLLASVRFDDVFNSSHLVKMTKRTFFTCSCHKMYRKEAVGLKSYDYALKITVFCEYVKFVWGSFLKIGYFANNCINKIRI